MNAIVQIAPTPAARQPDDPWTVSDLARRMFVSDRTIFNMIATGKLKSFKFGRRRLIPDSEVQRIMAGE